MSARRASHSPVSSGLASCGETEAATVRPSSVERIFPFSREIWPARSSSSMIAARVAAEELAWLIGRMTGGFYLRKGPVPEAAGRAAYGRLCACVLDFAANALADGELMAFIDPEGGVGLDPAALPLAAVAVARAVEEGAGALSSDHWEGLRG